MKKWKQNLILVCIAIFVSIIGHAYFIKNFILNDQIMGTTGDQFHQMIIFKDYLYRQFSTGNFFYDFSYMGGENIFTSLSYYFSTAVSFYIECLITSILSFFKLIQDVDLVYWGNMVLFASIVRVSVIIIITTKMLQYFNVKKYIALFSALFYAISPIYFHQTSLWEIFSDGFIWPPLLIWGVEKIIRERNGVLFSIGVALAIATNGYVAYMNFIMIGAYILLRLLFKLNEEEHFWVEQIKDYLFYGIIGIFIGLPGFIPFVLGFFKTGRGSGEFIAPLYSFDPNLNNFVFTDEYLALPMLFVVLATYYPIYSSKKVRFFFLISIVGIMLRFSPLVSSVMNGFSYPEERWIFLITIFYTIAIALGLNRISEGISKKNFLLGSLISILLTALIYKNSSRIPLSNARSILVEFWPVIFIATFVLFIVLNIFSNTKVRKTTLLLFAGLNIIVLYDQNRQLYYDNHMYEMDRVLLESTYLNDQNLVSNILNDIEEETDNPTKIDFTMDPLNISLVKGVPSYNIYSSFLNESYKSFITKAKIADQDEHLNMVNGFGGRQAIYSLLNLDHVISAEGNIRIPSEFSKIDNGQDYGETYIYENTLKLPFIHPVKYLYSEEVVASKNFDELIVSGAIVEDEIASDDEDSRFNFENINYQVELNNAHFNENYLSAKNKAANIEIALQLDQNDFDEIAIDYSLEPVNKLKFGHYRVNDKTFSMMGFNKIYSERRPNKIVTVAGDKNVTFKFESDTDYKFTINRVYGISYEGLKEYKEQADKFDYNIEFDKGQIEIQFDNSEGYPFMVLPIFNEPGWHVSINGVEGKIVNSNYGLIGFKIPNGELKINLEFKQPFFISSILISIVGVLCLIVKNRKFKKDNSGLIR